MPTTSFHSINGKIVGASSGASRIDFCVDGIGSVTGTVDATGHLENAYRFKPYGSQLSKVGLAADLPLLWLGSLGPRTHALTYSNVSFISGCYSTEMGQWITRHIDPITVSQYSRQPFASSTLADLDLTGAQTGQLAKQVPNDRNCKGTKDLGSKEQCSASDACPLKDGWELIDAKQICCCRTWNPDTKWHFWLHKIKVYQKVVGGKKKRCYVNLEEPRRTNHVCAMNVLHEEVDTD